MKCLIICFRYFAVDGNFTEWGAWSPCSQTCENGTQIRFRDCTNPPPAFGGRDCVGPTNETRACNDGPCPGGLPVLSMFIVIASFLLFSNNTERVEGRGKNVAHFRNSIFITLE